MPTLRPPDIVVLDNLGSHKGELVRKAVRAVDARPLFLPAYRPDLNPAAQVFAELGHFMRKACARNIGAT